MTAADGRPGPVGGGAGWLALGAGPLLALLVYLPTLGGSFLSDDFLLNTILRPDDPARIDWPAVFDDFLGPFAGLEGGGLYRPLVTVSIALNYAVGGAEPFGYHLVNLLLAMVASLACAWTCAGLVPERPARAALLGGALLALHPTLAETTGWVVARNSGLQLAFATVAMAGFVAWLRNGRRGGLLVAVLGLVGGLATKETAVLLPCSFVALDLLFRWGRGAGAGGALRVRVHLAMFAVVAAYFGWRRLVLGAFVGGGGPGTAAIEGADPLVTLGMKFGMLLLPVGSGLPAPWGALCGGVLLVGLLGLLAPALGDRVGRRMVALGSVWVALHFAPTWRLAVLPADLVGSRMVVGAVAVLAVLVGALAARCRRRRWVIAAALATLVGLAPLALGRMAQFLRAYDDMGHLQAALTDVAAGAGPERPVGVVTVNRSLDGIPFLNCNAVFPLLERPIATRDTPLVSFGFVFQPVPGSEHLLFDVGPWRAVREMGGILFEWHRAPGVAAPLTRVDRRPEPAPPLPALQPVGADRFVAPAAVDTFAVEALEVDVEGACQGGRVAWLYFDGTGQPVEFRAGETVPAAFRAAPRQVELRAGVGIDGGTRFHVDLSRALTFLALRQLGGLAGFRVTLQGGRVRAVRMLPRLDELPLSRVVAGAVVELDRTDRQLVVPTPPAGAAVMTLFLVGPDTTLTVPVTPGPLQLDAATRQAIRIILRSSRQDLYYFYFTATGQRSWRSPVDRVVFRAGPR